MFAQSLKKNFSGHHFIFLTFLKKMNLKHCITLIVTKKGLLSIDLYLRFRPELICKNLPDMLKLLISLFQFSYQSGFKTRPLLARGKVLAFCRFNVAIKRTPV